MAEWRVVIADDEPAARRGVRQLLVAFQDFHVVAECRNGAEALTAIEKKKPHLLFLDIHMPGVDGFDVLQRAATSPLPLVVFLTAYAQFAVRAFEAEAVDYLLKPVSEARFQATIERVERRLREEEGTARIPAFRIPLPGGTRLIRVADIEWIEAAGNYARLWTNGRSHLHRESLTELEPRLRGAGFVRIHRSAIIRLDRVETVVKESDGSLTAVLRSGTRVPVSRRRRSALNAAMR